MKKTGLLNCHISNVIAKMGHTDALGIGDCGLPIPEETQRIDLALIKDVPRFVDVLKAVLLEQEVEEVIIARETKEINPTVYEDILKILGDVTIKEISHEELKERLKACKAVIRTGEHSPYANIILKSGVVF